MIYIKICLLFVLAHYALGDAVDDLNNDDCFTQLAPDSFTCTKGKVPDFDGTKLQTDCGIADIEIRCCALAVFYDCMITSPKKQEDKCRPNEDVKPFDNMKTKLDSLKKDLDADMCKLYKYKPGLDKCVKTIQTTTPSSSSLIQNSLFTMIFVFVARLTVQN